MLIRNIKNNTQDLPEHLRNYAYGYVEEDGTMDLTVGKNYIVAGIRRIDDDTSYLVVPDYYEDKSFPWWFPSTLFEVEDSRIPDDWVLGGVEGGISFTFPELAEDYHTGVFQNGLEDGDNNEVAIFKVYYDKYKAMYKDLLNREG